MRFFFFGVPYVLPRQISVYRIIYQKWVLSSLDTFRSVHLFLSGQWIHKAIFNSLMQAVSISFILEIMSLRSSAIDLRCWKKTKNFFVSSAESSSLLWLRVTVLYFVRLSRQDWLHPLELDFVWLCFASGSPLRRDVIVDIKRCFVKEDSLLIWFAVRFSEIIPLLTSVPQITQSKSPSEFCHRRIARMDVDFRMTQTELSPKNHRRPRCACFQECRLG